MSEHVDVYGSPNFDLALCSWLAPHSNAAGVIQKHTDLQGRSLCRSVRAGKFLRELRTTMDTKTGMESIRTHDAVPLTILMLLFLHCPCPQ